MGFKVGNVRGLFNELVRVTKQSLDGPGFRRMSDLITEKVGGNVSPRYLSETLLNKIKDTDDEVLVTIRPHNLDKIAEYLGYENFQDYIDQQETPTHPVLTGCIGAYMCYLRRNTEKGMILASPVRIFEKEGKIVLELKGPDRSYNGEVSFKNNCLFILMKAKNEKEFHHVYEIGQREKPGLLQGIFSGVSTSFEPIGGRVVLKRTEEEFKSLKNLSAEVKVLKKSRSLEERRIAEYFERYEENNLKIKRSITFGVDDLGGCD